MTERTIPILPTRSIDETLAFYEALGFVVTYRQARPNTFAIVVRGGIELQFFVLKALDPANSYSTCYVLVDAVDALYAAFTEGLRAALGSTTTNWRTPQLMSRSAVRSAPLGWLPVVVCDNADRS